jgi:transcriptional regulator with XRE-family HTH domain
MRTRLGGLIVTARKARGWSLRDLEKVCGVSSSMLSKIEAGKVKDPRFSTVIRIIDALGITLARAAATVRRR